MIDPSFEQEVSILIDKPHMAQVIMLNDDYTPMDFVIEVLMEFFEKNHNQATKIMLDVHQKGSGICGIYPYDIPELKLELVQQRAKSNQFPLQLMLKDL